MVAYPSALGEHFPHPARLRIRVNQEYRMRLLRAVTLCLLLGSPAFAAGPVPSTAPSEWSTIPVATSKGVTVTLRVRQSATWTQRDWLQIVIDNAGNDVPLGGDFDYARWNLFDGRIYEKSTGTYLRN